ncbi:SLBB domain-containing protein [Mangrovibacterium diazotrophicum]|uniref:Protein involved in polysaccharide export with SLBB domain n=1 Tax=Mangrovibacterium diazotrophicum TaxID=1261403 RepID=A0A419W5Q0_9BACT|nr:SLBB domain-containing protein [Mangrovibacterium diazotrophicum]RKD90766.1 protein involved in polysaccharide export with SLBB domain [Mangrovibacterium diazotrophicum]
MFRSFVMASLIVLLSGAPMLLKAQTDVSSVNVENLSDAQVTQIVQEIQDRGLTPNEAAELARARGASQQQIDQLMARIQQVQMGGSSSNVTVSAASSETPTEANFSSSQTGAGKRNTPTTTKNQRIFGYQLFNQNKLSFEPSVNIPVPADYVVGIGDELSINVWGASQQTYLLQVDGNGSVNIPDLGPVKVAGQNFDKVRASLLKRLSAIYSGMTGGNPNTFAEVSINNLRSIKVNVVGEAINPGTYTLPATASAFNALYLSGGPNENGSFRSIRIMRDNKVAGEIDVYDYLLNNNTANNIALRDQDIIFIPTYHKRVEAIGAFKRDAIFELKEGENINQLLKYTGGFTDKASQARLLITRFTEDGYKLEDVKRDAFGSFTLQNGDVIRAEEVINMFENRVSIDGAVYRPGTYALDDNMKLSALLTKAGGLVPNYFSERGLIIRLDKQLYPTTIPFDVNEVLSGTNDPVLQKEDQIIIRDIFSIGERKTIRILGEVMKPEEYSFYRNMTLKDLIFLAGGMKEAASESYIEVARRNSYQEAADINSKMVSLYTFAVSRDLNLSDEDAAFILQPFDQVYVRKAPSYDPQRTVTILGEVKYPGQYSISSKDERISDLVERAGGLTPYAFTEGARMRRMVDADLKAQIKLANEMRLSNDTTLQALQEQKFKTLELQLSDILNKPGSDNDYTLKMGDEIYVPVRSEEVWVNGEVMNPTGLSFNSKKAKYYINASGGFTGNAKKGKMYVVYANGTSSSTKHFIFRKYPKVEQGSQIVVPQKPEKQRAEVTTWLAIASTLSSLAIAIAAVVK